MWNKLIKLLIVLSIFAFVLSAVGCTLFNIVNQENNGQEDYSYNDSENEKADDISLSPTEDKNTESDESENVLDERGIYTSKDDVALYIHIFGHLPDNFVSKEEARAAGWSGGSLEEYFPDCCIGGDRFGNYEGLLPYGHIYTECDIDTLGASSRGAKRIVFSDDGLIYYTDDHYDSFTLLYGEE